MKINKIITVVLLLLTQQFIAQELDKNNKWSSGRPDGHAPISVMGDHTHHKGGLMFSYRYMNMFMEGLQQGKDNISASDARAEGYMVAPINMPMSMHMLGAMYAVSNDITLMVMGSYITNNMDLQTGMNVDFSTSSAGFGDVKLGMLYTFINKNHQTLHGQIGVSLPTGTLEAKDVIPASNGNEILLPYPMQIGSGTFDADLALTYLGQTNSISWGTQLKGTYRFGRNEFDYSLGNRYSLNSWLAVKVNDYLSLSGRVEGLSVGKINGENLNLNPVMVTTADTTNSGGNYINTALGFNIYAFKGSLKNVRFGAEYALPVYQDLKGIQLAQQQTITLGLQYAL